MELKEIIEIVNNHFEVDLSVTKRTREMVMVRACYYYLAKKKTKCSLAKIGREIGRDHATVLHTLKNFENWLFYDKDFEKKFDNLKQKVFYDRTVKHFEQKKLKNKYELIKIAKDLLINEITILKEKQNGKN